jgi:hypothetical protein
MSALTSTQSGNWTASATWGGSTPADGDTFTIAQGHIVTINSDERGGTGFGDILVRGNLHFATNGKIRINGRVTVQGNASTDYSKSNGVSAQDFTEGGGSSGALLSATGNNILLEFEGTNSDQHGIWIENISYSSWKFIGDDSVTTTELSAIANPGDEYITVDSVSGFSAGDWVSAYNGDSQHYAIFSDEGFWVHDIDASNKRIYTKKYVGPKSIISSASGTSVVVDWSTIWRVGYKVIFGTGDNRNVRTITAINHRTKTLTLNSNITGTIPSGTEMYETGLDKKHLVDHQVRRNAGVLTTAGAVNDTTVVVSDSTDLSVGDIICVDVNNNVDTNWDYNSTYTVTGKSGTTLTISPALEHVRKVGSVVLKMNRSIQIKSVDTDVRAFCYVEYDTDGNRAGTREIGLKDVEWYGMGGNTGNTFYQAAVMVAGYNSDNNGTTTDSRRDYQSKIENCSVYDSNGLNAYTGLSWRHAQGLMIRNNVSVNSAHRVYWGWSSQYQLQFMNNYGSRCAYAALEIGAAGYDYSEYAYNYLTRSDDYGMMINHLREVTPVHNNILLNHENRFFYSYYQAPGTTFKRMHADGFRYVAYTGIGGGMCVFEDSYINNGWFKQVPGVYDGYTDFSGAGSSSIYLGYGGWSSRADYTRATPFTMYSQYTDWCFEEGLNAVVEANANLTFQRGTGDTWTILQLNTEHALARQSIAHIPANTAVTVKGQFKGQASGSWSYPYLAAKKLSNRNLGKYETAGDDTTFLVSSDASSVNSMFNGFYQEDRFTSASGAWQEKSLSITAQKYAYTLVTGYRMDSDNSQEIGYVKDIKIILPRAAGIRNSFGSKVQAGTGKKRISGRI